ncbi:hypothetical protein Y032_0050g1995 [Ancylostoma ceylanicum]|uniref:Uncharacterized protein n=1 Tax=Ancylostoma ceylanicum TaxID=53326 RepID=A0A016U8Y7_9BILA|nr:hypothetical protein Y032_0050g1995 [Ancylostoma ceylanicum]
MLRTFSGQTSLRLRTIDPDTLKHFEICILGSSHTSYSPCAQSAGGFRARRGCDACAVRPACNSGPASSLSCSRTSFVRIRLE